MIRLGAFLQLISPAFAAWHLAKYGAILANWPNPNHYAWLIAFATCFFYLALKLHNTIYWTKPFTPIEAFVMLNKKTLTALLLVSLLLTISFYFAAPFWHISMFILLIPVLFYNSFPNKRSINLRNTLVKPFFIGFIWILITLIIPLAIKEKFSENIYNLLTNFLVIVAFAMLQDLLDKPIDKQKGFKNPSSVFNQKIIIFFIAFGILLTVFESQYINLSVICLLLLILLITIVLCNNKPKTWHIAMPDLLLAIYAIAQNKLLH